MAAEGDAHGGHWKLFAILSLNEQGQLFECLGFERDDRASAEDASSMCNSETRSPVDVAVAWTKGFVYGDTWIGFNEPLGKVVATLKDGRSVEAAVNPAATAGMTRGAFVIVMPSTDDVPARVDAYDAKGKKVGTGRAPTQPTPLATELTFPPAS